MGNTSGTAISNARRRIVRALVPVYLVLIAGLPSLLTITLLRLPVPRWASPVLFALMPVSFCVVYVLTCGVLSMLTRSAIVPGRFPRDVGHRVYGPRRLYALCWTSIYYFTPLYHAVLALPLLRRIVFRMFGYRGSLNITLYPDTWIRDLTVLEIDEGAYVSNRATVGTNMCLMDGDVLVQPVRIERGAMVGHLAMVGPGAVIRAGAEVGVGAAIGLFADIGQAARVGPCTTVHHYARIGAGTDVGAHCYIGLKAVIGAGIQIPSGSSIPKRAVITSQDQVAQYVNGGAQRVRRRARAAAGRF